MRRASVAILLSLALSSCSSFGEAADELATPSAPTVTPSDDGSATVPPGGATASGSTGAKPPIVVDTPRPGDEVVSPVTVSGTANVFEGTVAIVLVGADARHLAATFATATCGSGCRGRYETDVAFFVERRQEATIRVFEESAEDGSALHVVEIPVVLVAGA